MCAAPFPYVCYCHDADQTDKLVMDKKVETHEANESSENECENLMCMSVHVSIQTCLLVFCTNESVENFTVPCKQVD
jgi:hypothetical protein